MNAHLQLKPTILSSGVYLPDQIVKSDDIFEEFHSETDYGIPSDWMSTEMGIKERRMAPSDAKPSDIAIPAAREALAARPEIDPSEIDMVIFCGIERDQPEPATAHTVQKALGINADIAFDVADACFGFIDGIRIASNFVMSGTVRYGLVVTGEIPTRLITSFVKQLKQGMTVQQARKVIGFLSVGDAGGAVIIGPSEAGSQSGFEIFTSRTNSAHSEKCYYKHKDDGEIEGQMLMARIVAHTTRLQREIYDDGLQQAGWDKPDFLLVHQVGQKSFNEVIDLGLIERDRMVKSYDVLGNITSATFPVNHHALMQDKRLKTGDKIYGCYSGSGIVVGQFAYTH